MTFEQAVNRIADRKPLGMNFGLERMKRALTLLGHPERALHAVHIAGTNGKGSTAAMIAAMCTAAGYRTGRYTSPAIADVRDTITIDETPISGEMFAALTDEIDALTPQMQDVGPLTEFEFVTVLTLTWFAREHTDLCVVECGLGGDTDATNVFDTPAATVFTPIALDHTDWLGSTIADIARRKSGIMKPKAAVISAPDQSEEALGVLFERAAALGLTVRMPHAAAATVTGQKPNHTAFFAYDKEYTLSLNGAFQINNALTALETVDSLAAQGFPVGEDARRAGLAAVRLPCRQEWIEADPPILLDGAHNPHGVAALANTIPILCGDRTPLLLTGMLRDKDVAAVADRLRPLVREVVCCTPDNPRALPAADLAPHYAPLPVTVIDPPETAFAAAYDRAKALGRPLVVGGSFYVSGAVRPLALSR
ncbi:MAG: bifunctional folylpolyglutamate synthase/dihydrofolate synthase [Clostridia bacterium]|nr:bifunctional folylpolyglutamate synthase/dihydrofolate synthase [Clostridia bacterium]